MDSTFNPQIGRIQIPRNSGNLGAYADSVYKALYPLPPKESLGLGLRCILCAGEACMQVISRKQDHIKLFSLYSRNFLVHEQLYLVLHKYLAFVNAVKVSLSSMYSLIHGKKLMAIELS